MKSISIKGARTHNLKNIDLELPRDRLIVITGLSGSGKSSLAFDTLYAEGQRRYVESLSAYARQFLSMMEKPDVDHIEGLSPAISIEQKSTSHNPRSTVGTITEIYDYLRLLFAKIGEPKCPEHGHFLHAQTISQMVDTVLALPNESKIMILSPVVKDRKGEHVELFQKLKALGFVRVRVDGTLYDLSAVPALDLRKKHTIEVVVDRLKVKEDARLRLAESFETAVRLSEGSASLYWMDDEKRAPIIFSSKYACPDCGYSLTELSPRLFSFNSPTGACSQCDGLGVQESFDVELIVSQEKTLSEGAIRGWGKNNGYFFHILSSLSSHFGFSLEQPFRRLSKKNQDILLHGSDEPVKFQYRDSDGRKFSRVQPFEGVIANFHRRYREGSVYVREDLKTLLSEKPCASCQGGRLNLAARHVFVQNYNLPALCAFSISDLLSFFKSFSVEGYKGEIAKKINKEVVSRLLFLMDVGLDYLSLDRRAETLSGGEAQRIRLASQIGSGLVGVMYILDEPSIGLHSRDNERLINTLIRLRDLGNTVLVVEHDEEAIRAADHVVDLGIGAGVHGGEIIASGPPSSIIRNARSLTGQYLSGKRKIALPKKRRQPDLNRMISIQNAHGNNLKNVTVDIPVGLFTCVTGVSGSGKSTLINDTLAMVAERVLNGAKLRDAAAHDAIEGLDHLDKAVIIDQTPIGRTPRSNPATYTGLFTPIRDLFAATEEARSRGYSVGRFSFNVKGGRCEPCEGEGVVKVEMHFLADVYVTCDVCQGRRYNRETLEVTYKGKNISEVLDMTVETALAFFSAVPAIARKLQAMMDVGLSYISLGQSATTLSGGEAQRVKLAKELSRRDTGKTLYILDEPTTGLHFYDIDQLLSVLHRLRDHGNTIVVIEHNMDVIKTADWLIDLGPEGGKNGGEVIACGSPLDVIKIKKSYTGKFLSPYLKDKKNK